MTLAQGAVFLGLAVLVVELLRGRQAPAVVFAGLWLVDVLRLLNVCSPELMLTLVLLLVLVLTLLLVELLVVLLLNVCSPEFTL